MSINFQVFGTRPKDAICVTYLKTRSLSQFSQKITELLANGEPARGIFKAAFQKHSSDLGNYYSVTWDWRDRQTQEEQDQLAQIALFLQSQPVLIDLAATKSLISTDKLTPAEITQLIQSAATQHLFT